MSKRKRSSRMDKKTLTIIAVILIVIGIVVLAVQGITYTTREDVVKLGPLHVTAEETRTIPAPPVLGGIALVGGIVLLVVAVKKR